AVFSLDRKTLFTGDDDGNIFLYHVDTEKPIQTLHTVTSYPLIVPNDEQDRNLLLSPIQSLTLSKDGNILAAGRLDGKIILWDTKTKTFFTSFTYPNLLYKVLLSSDGRLLVSSDKKGTIILWDVTKKVPLRTIHATA